VTLAPASTSVVTVAFATSDGTATAGSDYTATTGLLTFQPGVTTQTVVVPVVGDTAVEGDETFTVTLSNATNATLGDNQAIGTITNDDGVPGLVAAYGFDEASGAVVTDASGAGNTGTITGATRTASGRFGGALVFGGTGNWVTVNDSASLDLTTGMTLEAWVNPSATTSWQTVLMKESSTGLAYALFGRDTSRPVGYVNLGGSDRGARGTTSLTSNTWTHLAVTYDGARLRLYVNGVQVRSSSYSGAIASTAGALRIGGNSLSGEYFQGRIDEVRVYNRALSASEIQTDMNTAVVGP
jgi:hypothetical protein